VAKLPCGGVRARKSTQQFHAVTVDDTENDLRSDDIERLGAGVAPGLASGCRTCGHIDMRRGHCSKGLTERL
jgi:hypothetical protein